MMENFSTICRDYYQRGVLPINSKGLFLDGNDNLSIIAKKNIENSLEDFMLYFSEGHYYINLWAAHFVLEAELTSAEIVSAALDIILRYSKSKLNKTIAEREVIWLTHNFDRWQ